MKNILIILLLTLSSCKKEPIDLYYKSTNPCITNKWDGNYKSIGITGVNWKFTDTLFFTSTTRQAKIEFIGQTNVNSFTTYFKAPNNCGINEFAFKADSIDLIHYIICRDSCLTDFIISNNDTLGIKYYQKY